MPPQVVAEAVEAAAPSFTSSSVRVRIPIASDADLAVAGEHGRRLASRLDFSPTDITVIATAILEVARNVLAYASRGDLMLHLIQKRGRLGLAIVARDKGPGIVDVGQALRDGKGLGLATARRLMDEFRVRSEPGRGTTVTMRKWTRCRQVERAGARRLGHAGLREVR
ncbi:MAG TPA: ATP-binding protein [Gemmatimonadales bacterium]|nr:ATP-binding protein [Gemmatimonadales bacterium]